MRYLRFLLIGSFVSVAIIVALITLDVKLISDYLSGILIQEAARHGVTLSISTLSPFFLGVELTTLKAFIARSLLSLSIDMAKLNCNPIQILGGAAQCSFQASLYGGEAFGSFHANAQDGELQNSTISGVTLSQHPQFAGFGIEQGSLSVLNAIAKWSGGKIETGNAQIIISNLSKPTQTTIPQRISGLPMPITIPPISAEKIKADVALHPNQVHFESIEATTNHGTLAGSVRLAHGSLPDSELRITLTETGSAALKPHLQFICEASLITPGSPIVIRTTKASGFRCSAN